MKPNKSLPCLPQRRYAQLFLAVVSALALDAGAASTDISTVPLTSGTGGTVKPNLMFILDDSGSMASSYLPDDVNNFEGRYGYVSAQCNGVYYNPAIKYVPPKNADGTSFADMSFIAALDDGYVASSTKVNLGAKFQAYGSDAQQAAYYYTYSGSVTDKDYANTSSTFYKQCNSSIGSNPGKLVFAKVTVSATSGPGSTDERTNFANWYSYYRTRMLMMKTGSGRAFAGVDSTYRVGFTTISYVGTDTLNAEFLNISDFDATQKAAWYDKFYKAVPSGYTPLRGALSKTGRIFAGKIGTDPVQYSCQQNFTILSTDGYWNTNSETATYGPFREDGATAVGNQDATDPRPLFEGPTAGSNSLADVAAYYYKTDLRPGGPCLTGATLPDSTKADVCKNEVPTTLKDPATHQHMTTFTLGLGVDGLLKYSDTYDTGGSADYTAIVQGTKNWPVPVANTRTTVDDLWHAAVNGHGLYFSARNPDTLVSGLSKALSGVTARIGSGAAAATSSIEPVPGDNFAFVANYRTVFWDGELQARVIDLTSGAISTTPTWSAQSLLDAKAAADTRTIYTYSSAATDASTKLKIFLPANFTPAEKSAWFDPAAAPALSQYATLGAAEKAAATADSVINFLRGQSGNEDQASNLLKLYRDREHVLGDVVNAKPVFVRIPPFNYGDIGYAAFKKSNAIQSRKGVVYLAANDGMLHAFNSSSGDELWAFIPSFVLPELKRLADKNYGANHRYFTDGVPTVGDVYDPAASGSTKWKTLLVAGLNSGGRGYYALDVTDPDNPKALWEFSNVNLGLTYGNPLITKLMSGQWVVIFSSGYNNNVGAGDGEGHLFILDANTGALLSEIKTGVGSAGIPSGLGKIAGFTSDPLVDNTVQRVYGGDLEGNLWRMDVNDVIPPAGQDAFLLAEFKVAGKAQPITTRPQLSLVGTTPVIYVGTGRLLGLADLGDPAQQSFYAIREKLTTVGIGDARTASGCKLVEQKLTVTSPTERTITKNPVDFTTDCGWYIDFNPSNDSPGERVNVDPGLQLGVLAVVTNVPENSVCTIGGTSWLYFLNFSSGAGFVNDIAGTKLGNELTVGSNTFRLPDGKVITTTTGASGKLPEGKGNPENKGAGSGAGKRMSWRELFGF